MLSRERAWHFQSFDRRNRPSIRLPRERRWPASIRTASPRRRAVPGSHGGVVPRYDVPSLSDGCGIRRCARAWRATHGATWPLPMENSLASLRSSSPAWRRASPAASDSQPGNDALIWRAPGGISCLFYAVQGRNPLAHRVCRGVGARLGAIYGRLWDGQRPANGSDRQVRTSSDKIATRLK